jgi:hypothetical protein
MSKGFRSCLAVQEGSGVATRPSAPDPTSPLRRRPTLTRVIQLRTAPASEVGSSADMCLMALHMPWPAEIKECLAAMVCSEARVFLRHICALPRRLLDGVILTCKSYGYALRCHATVYHHAADRSLAWRYSAAPCS